MPFPDIDPVLIQIGPFAIRWYALAYIVDLILGWRYIVALAETDRLWQPRSPSPGTTRTTHCSGPHSASFSAGVSAMSFSTTPPTTSPIRSKSSMSGKAG